MTKAQYVMWPILSRLLKKVPDLMLYNFIIKTIKKTVTHLRISSKGNLET